MPPKAAPSVPPPPPAEDVLVSALTFFEVTVRAAQYMIYSEIQQRERMNCVQNVLTRARCKKMLAFLTRHAKYTLRTGMGSHATSHGCRDVPVILVEKWMYSRLTCFFFVFSRVGLTVSFGVCTVVVCTHAVGCLGSYDLFGAGARFAGGVTLWDGGGVDCCCCGSIVLWADNTCGSFRFLCAGDSCFFAGTTRGGCGVYRQLQTERFTGSLNHV